jgi:hypothetical protein
MMDRDKFQNWKNGVTDRRKWERHPPTKGTIALLNGRSYRMMDISFGGMSIYDYGGETVSEETIVELHCYEEGLFSSAIRGFILKCHKMPEGFGQPCCILHPIRKSSTKPHRPADSGERPWP